MSGMHIAPPFFTASRQHNTEQKEEGGDPPTSAFEFRSRKTPANSKFCKSSKAIYQTLDYTYNSSPKDITTATTTTTSSSSD
jgi:hypothetical protein